MAFLGLGDGSDVQNGPVILEDCPSYGGKSGSRCERVVGGGSTWSRIEVSPFLLAGCCCCGWDASKWVFSMALVCFCFPFFKSCLEKDSVLYRWGGRDLISLDLFIDLVSVECYLKSECGRNWAFYYTVEPCPSVIRLSVRYPSISNGVKHLS